MARSKKKLKNRSKAHIARIGGRRLRRTRAKSRGYHPLSKRRKMKAARRANHF